MTVTTVHTWPTSYTSLTGGPLWLQSIPGWLPTLLSQVNHCDCHYSPYLANFLHFSHRWTIVTVTTVHTWLTSYTSITGEPLWLSLQSIPGQLPTLLSQVDHCDYSPYLADFLHFSHRWTTVTVTTVHTWLTSYTSITGGPLWLSLQSIPGWLPTLLSQSIPGWLPTLLSQVDHTVTTVHTWPTSYTSLTGGPLWLSLQSIPGWLPTLLSQVDHCDYSPYLADFLHFYHRWTIVTVTTVHTWPTSYTSITGGPLWLSLQSIPGQLPTLLSQVDHCDCHYSPYLANFLHFSHRWTIVTTVHTWLTSYTSITGEPLWLSLQSIPGQLPTLLSQVDHCDYSPYLANFLHFSHRWTIVTTVHTWLTSTLLSQVNHCDCHYSPYLANFLHFSHRWTIVTTVHTWLTSYTSITGGPLWLSLQSIPGQLPTLLSQVNHCDCHYSPYLANFLHFSHRWTIVTTVHSWLTSYTSITGEPLWLSLQSIPGQLPTLLSQVDHCDYSPYLADFLHFSHRWTIVTTVHTWLTSYTSITGGPLWLQSIPGQLPTLLSQVDHCDYSPYLANFLHFSHRWTIVTTVHTWLTSYTSITGGPLWLQSIPGWLLTLLSQVNHCDCHYNPYLANFLHFSHRWTIVTAVHTWPTSYTSLTGGPLWLQSIAGWLPTLLSQVNHCDCHYSPYLANFLHLTGGPLWLQSIPGWLPTLLSQVNHCDCHYSPYLANFLHFSHRWTTVTVTTVHTWPTSYTSLTGGPLWLQSIPGWLLTLLSQVDHCDCSPYLADFLHFYHRWTIVTVTTVHTWLTSYTSITGGPLWLSLQSIPGQLPSLPHRWTIVTSLQSIPGWLPTLLSQVDHCDYSPYLADFLHFYHRWTIVTTVHTWLTSYTSITGEPLWLSLQSIPGQLPTLLSQVDHCDCHYSPYLANFLHFSHRWTIVTVTTVHTWPTSYTSLTGGPLWLQSIPGWLPTLLSQVNHCDCHYSPYLANFLHFSHRWTIVTTVHTWLTSYTSITGGPLWLSLQSIPGQLPTLLSQVNHCDCHYSPYLANFLHFSHRWTIVTTVHSWLTSYTSITGEPLWLSLQSIPGQLPTLLSQVDHCDYSPYLADFLHFSHRWTIVTTVHTWLTSYTSITGGPLWLQSIPGQLPTLLSQVDHCDYSPYLANFLHFSHRWTIVTTVHTWLTSYTSITGGPLWLQSIPGWLLTLLSQVNHCDCHYNPYLANFLHFSHRWTIVTAVHTWPTSYTSLTGGPLWLQSIAGWLPTLLSQVNHCDCHYSPYLANFLHLTGGPLWLQSIPGWLPTLLSQVNHCDCHYSPYLANFLHFSHRWTIVTVTTVHTWLWLSLPTLLHLTGGPLWLQSIPGWLPTLLSQVDHCDCHYSPYLADFLHFYHFLHFSHRWTMWLSLQSIPGWLPTLLSQVDHCDYSPYLADFLHFYHRWTIVTTVHTWLTSYTSITGGPLWLSLQSIPGQLPTLLSQVDHCDCHYSPYLANFLHFSHRWTIVTTVHTWLTSYTSITGGPLWLSLQSIPGWLPTLLSQVDHCDYSPYLANFLHFSHRWTIVTTVHTWLTSYTSITGEPLWLSLQSIPGQLPTLLSQVDHCDYSPYLADFLHFYHRWTTVTVTTVHTWPTSYTSITGEPLWLSLQSIPGQLPTLLSQVDHCDCHYSPYLANFLHFSHRWTIVTVTTVHTWPTSYTSLTGGPLWLQSIPGWLPTLLSQVNHCDCHYSPYLANFLHFSHRWTIVTTVHTWPTSYTSLTGGPLWLQSIPGWLPTLLSQVNHCDCHYSPYLANFLHFSHRWTIVTTVHTWLTSYTSITGGPLWLSLQSIPGQLPTLLSQVNHCDCHYSPYLANFLHFSHRWTIVTTVHTWLTSYTSITGEPLWLSLQSIPGQLPTLLSQVDHCDYSPYLADFLHFYHRWTTVTVTTVHTWPTSYTSITGEPLWLSLQSIPGQLPTLLSQVDHCDYSPYLADFLHFSHRWTIVTTVHTWLTSYTSITGGPLWLQSIPGQLPTLLSQVDHCDYSPYLANFLHFSHRWTIVTTVHTWLTSYTSITGGPLWLQSIPGWLLTLLSQVNHCDCHYNPYLANFLHFSHRWTIVTAVHTWPTSYTSLTGGPLWLQSIAGWLPTLLSQVNHCDCHYSPYLANFLHLTGGPLWLQSIPGWLPTLLSQVNHCDCHYSPYLANFLHFSHRWTIVTVTTVHTWLTSYTSITGEPLWLSLQSIPGQLPTPHRWTTVTTVHTWLTSYTSLTGGPLWLSLQSIPGQLPTLLSQVDHCDYSPYLADFLHFYHRWTIVTAVHTWLTSYTSITGGPLWLSLQSIPGWLPTLLSQVDHCDYSPYLADFLHFYHRWTIVTTVHTWLTSYTSITGEPLWLSLQSIPGQLPTLLSQVDHCDCHYSPYLANFLHFSHRWTIVTVTTVHTWPTSYTSITGEPLWLSLQSIPGQLPTLLSQVNHCDCHYSPYLANFLHFYHRWTTVTVTTVHTWPTSYTSQVDHCDYSPYLADFLHFYHRWTTVTVTTVHTWPTSYTSLIVLTVHEKKLQSQLGLCVLLKWIKPKLQSMQKRV